MEIKIKLLSKNNPKTIKKFEEKINPYYKQGFDYTVDILNGQQRISQIVGCSRKAVFGNTINLPEDFYVRQSSAGGTAIHAILQAPFLEDKGKIIELEVNLKYKRLDIKGHIDLTILPEENDTIKIFDIKTNTNLDFIDKQGGNLKHIFQVMLYAFAFCQTKNISTDNITVGIWYIPRFNNRGDVLQIIDSKEWLLFEYTYNQDLVNYLLDRAENLIDLVANDRLPPFDSDKPDWECENSKNKCPYYKYCFVPSYHLTTIKAVIELMNNEAKKTEERGQ